MLDELTILGSGGWFPAHGRHTACALIRSGSSAIMIDAGTGISRLVERPDLLAGIKRLDVVLTHFHLDHVSGLAYIPAIRLPAETTLWGPGELLYGVSTQSLVGRLINHPFHPVPVDERQMVIRDLPAGEVELNGVRMDTRRQDRHSAPTLGLRFDDDLAWVTDTAPDPATQSFVSGCRVVAHETWFTSGQPQNPDVHSSAAQAADLAAQAGSEQLLMIHLPPFAASLEDLLDEAHGRFPGAELARDGATVIT
jgi:ribonuclease BN (tRNA processing enzyme)